MWLLETNTLINAVSENYTKLLGTAIELGLAMNIRFRWVCLCKGVGRDNRPVDTGRWGGGGLSGGAGGMGGVDWTLTGGRR